MNSVTKNANRPRPACRVSRIGAIAALAVLTAAPSFAVNRCAETAHTLFRACGFEVLDDFWVAIAKCVNISDGAERTECRADAATEQREENRVCRDQRAWRLLACTVLGPARYDPDFDAELFDDDFADLTRPNPYFPLTIGNTWEFTTEGETNTLEVRDEIKRIDGVACVVLRDLVFRDGELHEATDDWYAQAKNGDTWYCGEEVKNYESFDGDAPRLPELVDVDGSFKAGRDGDKAGIIFLAEPHTGDAYTEEFSLGNAEDVTEILATGWDFGDDPELDELVPQALAEFLCNGDCVVTKNYSLLEPGIFARKYYTPGIGVFLEVEVQDEVVVRLTGCNFDPRCETLPQ